MARSERAKELAAKQKAEAKALREAKKNSSDPKDWGTLRQIREMYKLTAQSDKQLTLWVVGTWLAVALAGLVIGLLLNNWVFGLIAGALFGITAALFMLTHRSKKATYTRYAGMPGSGEVALNMLNKKQYTTNPAITITRQQDCIHRVIGPSGVILIGDGDPGRLKPMLAAELKRHQQVLYGIDVHAIQMGDGEGQVPMDKVSKQINKMPKTLDALQIDQAKSRLKALDSMKQRIPLPKGPMPTSTKGARKAMRGR